MFRSLQLKKQPIAPAADPGALSLAQLIGDASLPIALRALSHLPPDAVRRLARVLLPPELLVRLEVNPLTWKGPGGEQARLELEPGRGELKLSVRAASGEEVVRLELADNALNGIDLNLLLLGDPRGPRFGVDFDEQGRSTLFGTVHRNLAEEERAMQAGLAPAQTRASLQASRAVLEHLEAFLTLLGQQAVFLEPLTYASAWIFERRGFAYVRGHKLMLDIQREFQPGGRLHQALDGSTPFRQQQQWRTVRGRAWAIHDGVLSALDASWNNLRMVKQIGRQAGVNTFPDAAY